MQATIICLRASLTDAFCAAHYLQTAGNRAYVITRVPHRVISTLESRERREATASGRRCAIQRDTAKVQNTAPLPPPPPPANKQQKYKNEAKFKFPNVQFRSDSLMRFALISFLSLHRFCYCCLFDVFLTSSGSSFTRSL